MSFEWQETDTAADTLGVNIETLQEWIDEGRAPSRQIKGNTQVLIELLDDDDVGDEIDDAENAADADGESTHGASDSASDDTSNDFEPEKESGTKADSGESAQGRQRVEATLTDLDLVGKRELQLAGGMVAAWQRLAEQSDANLVRSRRLGVFSWSIAAALLVFGGIGLWASSQRYQQVEGQRIDAQSKFDTADHSLNTAQTDIADLRSELKTLNNDLSTARTELATATQKAQLTDTNAKALLEPYISALNDAKKSAEIVGRLALRLEGDIDQQRKSITEQSEKISSITGQLKTLNEELVAARSELAESRKGIQAADKITKQQLTQIDAQKQSIVELMTRRDQLQRDVADAKKKADEATQLAANQKEAVADLQKEIKRLSALETKAKSVPGLESQVKALAEQLKKANETIAKLRDDKAPADGKTGE